MLQADTVARPYAMALFKIAQENGSTNVWQQTLCELSNIIQNKDIAKLIGNPKINQLQLTQDLKKGISNLPKELESFFNILLSNKRLLSLPSISTCFDKIVSKSTYILDVTIESAFPMTKEQENQFIQYLETKCKQKLKIKKTIVSPNLIGGMRAFIGDELFDYSVKSQLSNMRTAILA